MREATPDDLPRLLKIGREFYARSQWSAFSEWDDEAAAKTILFVINSNTGVVFISDTGAAGAMLYPIPWSGELIGQEIAWWGDFAMFPAMEEWARSRGAVAFQMAHLEGQRDKALDRVYRARGYAPAERAYVKRL